MNTNTISYLFNTILLNKNEDYHAIPIIIGLFIALMTHILFFFLFVFLEIYPLSIVNIFSVLFYFIVLRVLDYKYERILNILVYLEILVHAIIATHYLGLESGFHYYIYILAMTPLFIQKNADSFMFIRLSILIAILLVLDISYQNTPPLVNIQEEYLNLIRYFNLVGFLITGGVVTYIYTIKSNVVQNDLQIQSSTDSLTKIFNRRYAIKASNIEILRDKREERNTSVLMLDLDYFKKINDSYGHACGDEMLISTVHSIEKIIRPQDIFARWGGEEFLIILPDTQEKELRKVAHRILKSVEQNIIHYKGKAISVTVSIGGAVLKDYEDIFSFIERSDNAMYLAKQEGRNQFKLA